MLNPRAPRRLLVCAGLLGASAVGLGAWGAHAGPGRLTPAANHSWQTAVAYQAMHALALLALAALRAGGPQVRVGLVRLAGVLWMAGSVLFSGSLYLLALGGPRWLGPVTPLGGVGLLLGWLAVAGAGRRDHAG